MCQLLGMNCNTPTDFTFSFTGFAARGGDTDTHADGWGLAFYEGRGCRSFVDNLPSSASPIAEILKSYPIKTLNMLAHIRKATCGELLLENVHPFQRELWGRSWVFAHNGDVPLCRAPREEVAGVMLNYARATAPIPDPNAQASPTFMPIGDTDSEMAFCLLLNRLAGRYNGMPNTLELYDEVSLAQTIGSGSTRTLTVTRTLTLTPTLRSMPGLRTSRPTTASPQRFCGGAILTRSLAPTTIAGPTPALALTLNPRGGATRAARAWD